MPPSDAAWKQKLTTLRAHVAAHGRLPPQGDASGLGSWAASQRHSKKAMDAGEPSKHGTMTPARVAALESVPGWAWEVKATRWPSKLEALRAHVAAHGRLPQSRRGLGAWVATQRAAKKAADAGKATTMTPERAAALEAVPGWTWHVRHAAAEPAAPPAKRAKRGTI